MQNKLETATKKGTVNRGEQYGKGDGRLGWGGGGNVR